MGQTQIFTALLHPPSPFPKWGLRVISKEVEKQEEILSKNVIYDPSCTKI